MRILDLVEALLRYEAVRIDDLRSVVVLDVGLSESSRFVVVEGGEATPPMTLGAAVSRVALEDAGRSVGVDAAQSVGSRRQVRGRQHRARSTDVEQQVRRAFDLDRQTDHQPFLVLPFPARHVMLCCTWPPPRRTSSPSIQSSWTRR